MKKKMFTNEKLTYQKKEKMFTNEKLILCSMMLCMILNMFFVVVCAVKKGLFEDT
jgi:hypothetical protein